MQGLAELEQTCQSEATKGDNNATRRPVDPARTARGDPVPQQVHAGRERQPPQRGTTENSHHRCQRDHWIPLCRTYAQSRKDRREREDCQGVRDSEGER